MPFCIMKDFAWIKIGTHLSLFMFLRSIHKERSFQLSYILLFSCSFKQNLLYDILVSPVNIFNAIVVEIFCLNVLHI